MQVLHSIAETLRKGSGRVLVRDYAEGDLAESRLAASSRQQKLQDNFYVRGDGTQAYYFSQVRRRTLMWHGTASNAQNEISAMPSWSLDVIFLMLSGKCTSTKDTQSFLISSASGEGALLALMRLSCCIVM